VKNDTIYYFTTYCDLIQLNNVQTLSQKFQNKVADAETCKHARPTPLKNINKIGIFCFEPPKGSKLNFYLTIVA